MKGQEKDMKMMTIQELTIKYEIDAASPDINAAMQRLAAASRDERLELTFLCSYIEKAIDIESRAAALLENITYSTGKELSEMLKDPIITGECEKKIVSAKGHSELESMLNALELIPSDSLLAADSINIDSITGGIFKKENHLCKITLKTLLSSCYDKLNARAGELFRQQGDYENAAKALERVRAIQGNSVAICNELADCYTMIEEYSKAAGILRRIEAEGDAHTLYMLGRCSYNDPNASNESAFKYYLAAAEKNHAAAQTMLAYMYHNGIGVSQDFHEAFKWSERAANSGSTSAIFNLAECYYDGIGTEKNLHEASRLYALAAQQGDADAQYKFAIHFAENDNQKFEWLNKAAFQGNIPAQNQIGWMYERGLGTSQSYEKAFEWYSKAALQGFAVAQSNLGVLYEYGQGVPQSCEKAFEWYSKAALQGFSEAQKNLGNLYYNARGVPQSYEKAFEWFSRAALQGHAAAQNRIANMYSEGLGVPQSYEKALEWYSKAAEQGLAAAQQKLGMMYENGLGIPQSNELAIEWYSKATEQENPEAIYCLGAIEQLKGNSAEAEKLYLDAAAAGSQLARSALSNIYINRGDTKSALLYAGNITVFSKAEIGQAKEYFSNIAAENNINFKNTAESINEPELKALEDAVGRKLNAAELYDLAFIIETDDPVLSIYAYHLAAQQGSKNAMYTLVNMAQDNTKYFIEIENMF